MIGKGHGRKGAVGVAIRITDDCISAHANHSRIHQFNQKDKENCIYSDDVISFAKEKGYFKGKDKDFSFSSAYAEADCSALRGCDARVWSCYNKYSSDMDKYLPYLQGKEEEPLPLYIKPDRKLAVRDVQNMMRDHFEDTPFEMTKEEGAGPFKSPYRYRAMRFKIDGEEYVNERAIATQQTGLSLVAQMRSFRPDPIGGILWFGVDDANTAVYTPMYCGITEIPECYRVGNGDMLTFSWTSAFWIHNWVANQAYNRYEPMIGDIRKVQNKLEDSYAANLSQIDAKALELYNNNPAEALTYLNQYSVEQANQATAEWKSLGEYLLVKFIDGNIKKEKDGKFLRTPEGIAASPSFPGYSEEYYRQVVESAGDKLKITFE